MLDFCCGMKNKFEDEKINFKNKSFMLVSRYLGKKLTGLLIIVSIIALPIGGLYLYRDTLLTNKLSREALIRSLSPTPILPPLSPEIKTPLRDGNVLGVGASPCLGKEFDIIQDLDDVHGGEIPIHPDLSDPSIISASDAANFQVTKKYPFECKPPWTAQFSFTPLGEKSIGVFFEYENVFKVLIGDGDFVTWTLHKNDSGTRGKWTEVSKEKFKNGKLSLKKEVTVYITISKIEGSLLYGELKVSYVPLGKSNYEWESHNFILQPLAVDIASNPSREFRIGLNDYRYKGLGSTIKMGFFSVREIK